MMRQPTPADLADAFARFYGYLETWSAQQRAAHGSEAAKDLLRAYVDGVTHSIKVVSEFGPAGLIALHQVVTMVQTNVLSVACPTCGAEIGDLCWSSTRVGAKFANKGAHYDRQRAARGEYVPQDLDRWVNSRNRKQPGKEAADAAKTKR
jgi:hypothetical protein